MVAVQSSRVGTQRTPLPARLITIKTDNLDLILHTDTFAILTGAGTWSGWTVILD